MMNRVFLLAATAFCLSCSKQQDRIELIKQESSQAALPIPVPRAPLPKVIRAAANVGDLQNGSITDSFLQVTDTSQP